MPALPTLLRESIERWSDELWATSPLAHLARAGQVTPKALALYLESLRYLFQHSQRNLSLAARRAAALDLPQLAEYLAHKAHDEGGHDAWASDDLAQLPSASRVDLTPAEGVVRLVELQRALIAEHPLCFVVYAAWAEYFTVLVGDQWLDALSGCGYQRSAVSSIAKHVEADRAHAANGFNEIELLWKGEPGAAVLLDVVQRAARVFESFCEEIGRAARSAA